MILDKRVPIRTNTKRKGTLIAGYISYVKEGENTLPVFWKEVDRQRHYMRMVKGYGIQEGIYKGYIKMRRGWTVIKERDDKYLVAEMTMWDKHGKTLEFRGVDGAQRFLSEKFMQKTRSIDEMEDYLRRNPPENVSEQQPLLRFT